MKLNEFREFLQNLDQNKITFDLHFYKRSAKRPVDESLVRSFLSRLDRLEEIEQGKKDLSFGCYN